jgi:ATP-dependent Clp protease protease subunit
MIRYAEPHRPEPCPDPDRPSPGRPTPPRPTPPPPQPLPPAPQGPVPHPLPGTDAVRDRLLDERIVYLGGELDDAAADRLISELLLLAAVEPRRDITLYLNSTGGTAGAALAVYDTLRSAAPDVATCAVGLVGPVGTLLLAAGTAGKRSALPHARILLRRPARSGASAAAGIAQELRAEIVGLLVAHSGPAVATVLAEAAAERWLTATEALAHGLIDHIREA